MHEGVEKGCVELHYICIQMTERNLVMEAVGG